MHAATQSLVTDGLLSLLLGADEQDVAALSCNFLHVVVSLVQLLHGLLQVNDIDTIALGEDVLSHLGVPAAGLVTEVHTCLEKLLHRNDCHNKIPPDIVLPPHTVICTVHRVPADCPQPKRAQKGIVMRV